MTEPITPIYTQAAGLTSTGDAALPLAELNESKSVLTAGTNLTAALGLNQDNRVQPAARPDAPGNHPGL